jgi:hypothetical protein
MQILYYTPPDERGCGQFEFPLFAVVEYLRLQQSPAARQPKHSLLRELCSFRYHPLEHIHLDKQWEGEMSQVAAGMLDWGCLVAYCPQCQTYFTPSQIRVRAWDDGLCYHGRQYLCTQDHLLLQVKDGQYFSYPF